MANLRNLIINSTEVEVDPSLTLIHACEQAGIRSCWFAGEGNRMTNPKNLGIAGRAV